MNQNQAKDQLREQARITRRELAMTAGLGFGSALIKHFSENFKIEPGTKVAGYWPITREADVKPLLNLLHEKKCKCLLPVVVERDRPLLFREWQPGDELQPSDLDIPEPGADNPEDVPEILLVPLLAFDAKGYRLGYGGGFYDMTLQELRQNSDITAIGIAYSGQQVEAVPTDNFDQALDWVITEVGALKIN